MVALALTAQISAIQPPSVLASRFQGDLPHMELNCADQALAALGRALRQRGYRFTTVTPLSHSRVNARAMRGSPSLEDVFGWSRPFREHQVSDEIMHLLRGADALEVTETGIRSRVRFSSLGDQLFMHSAFPTNEDDAVFFGPDTYRFARAIRQLLTTMRALQPLQIVDIGAGSGAGGLCAARLVPNLSPAILLTDINHRALRFSRINAMLNDVPNVQVVQSNLFAEVEGKFDLI